MRTKNPQKIPPKSLPPQSSDLKTINPWIVFLFGSIASLIISFLIYISISEFGWADLGDAETWNIIFQNLFSPESLFFLIFFGLIGLIIVFIFFYNSMILLWKKKDDCMKRNGTWDKKKKICL